MSDEPEIAPVAEVAVAPPVDVISAVEAELSARDQLKEEPFKAGFLALLRELERSFPNKPAIGKNATLKEEIVSLGQDPFVEFPAANVVKFDDPKDAPLEVTSRFLGFYGPQGALPLNTTMEVMGWVNRRDPSFVAFTDLFGNRFLQLFFRAWSDAHAISSFDHPQSDRFQRLLGGLGGLGTESYLDRDRVSDTAKLQLIPLGAGRVRSAVRLEQMLEQLLDVEVYVEEHVPSWISFEAEDLSRLGAIGSNLGVNCYLGSRLRSVNDKIRIDVTISTLSEYKSFLPGGSNFARLTDLVKWYLGHQFEADVSLSLPRDQIPAAQLGSSATLGWLAALSPPQSEGDGSDILHIATFSTDQDVPDAQAA